jgi:hypothetical protein
MPRTREEILESRRRVRENYGELFDATVALLYRHDPIGINFEVNPDEYQPEAETILPRLSSCRSAEDVLHVVHHEFVRWFGTGTAGPPERYAEVASQLWQLWQAYLHKSHGS